MTKVESFLVQFINKQVIYIEKVCIMYKHQLISLLKTSVFCEQIFTMHLSISVCKQLTKTNHI
ncbi:hypothetical protein HanXRQr2_Chr16g0759531 [Helianthus annuus]|uniref:Uncharacterized protein n=1 Tax=Helianthus annuus TaxID=4232 RepID=A0A251S176_HELAN|nr:hypothetical protein HanXRQr2_Chr16g0759531 [Helianthus annuus]KAJ0822082.1 hypothetical protein HanPSC8_Chr16g0727811 [Helianthus annuus]